MRIQKLRIRNFRAIKNMVLDNLENALILVGKNSTGKTAILEAISMVAGTYQVSKHRRYDAWLEDFKR